MSGNVSDSEIRNIGKQAGADYVVDVNVRAIGEEVVMTARIINIESGEMIYSTTLKNNVDTPEEVLGLAGRCARKVYQDYKDCKSIK